MVGLSMESSRQKETGKANNEKPSEKPLRETLKLTWGTAERSLMDRGNERRRNLN